MSSPSVATPTARSSSPAVPIHDLPDIGVHELPGGAYTTIAGLVLDRLGRLPDGPGDTAMVAGWALHVTGFEGRAITEVRLRRVHRDDRARDPASTPRADRT